MTTPAERQQAAARRRVATAACQMWGRDLINDYGENVEVFSSPRHDWRDRLSPPRRVRFDCMFGPFMWEETEPGFEGRFYALWLSVDGRPYQGAGDQPQTVYETSGDGVPSETWDKIIKRFRAWAREESLPMEIR